MNPLRSGGDGRPPIWRRISPGSAEAYALAVIFVVIASLSRWGLGYLTQELQAFTTFYPAVVFAALLGGAGPGIVATILGGAISWWSFLPPYTSLLPLSTADEINLFTYFVASGLIVWATDHYRRLVQRLRDEERFRKLAVDELAHRLKNKIATIQAIIGFRLREQHEVKDEIIGSLNALMATDNLIMASQGEGANLRDILSTEFAPYDLSRISMAGSDCLLSSKIALTMALLVHELVTNAAKYGALSNATGRLSITWSISGERLNLAWFESDGPLVVPPSHSGFGTRLFKQALRQFDGTVDANFAPSGLICRLSVVLPDQAPNIVPEAPGKSIDYAAD
ncbi:MAG: sensor histidine kinase [Pseudolabrys sp.]